MYNTKVDIILLATMPHGYLSNIWLYLYSDNYKMVLK